MLEKEPNNRIELEVILGMPIIISNAILKLPADILRAEFPLHVPSMPVVPNLPVNAENGVYDTSDDYLKDNVSYGIGDTYNLFANGTTVTFISNVTYTGKQIDERNLS